MFEFNYDHHLQYDGSKAGYWGYPFLLFQLLHNHNKTAKFEVINFSADNFTLFSNAKGKNMSDLCEYK